MAQLIETVTIEEPLVDNANKGEKWEGPLEEEDVNTLASMPWREYLRRANFNKDPHKMCELCIAEQKRKFNGKTPIICKGYDYYTNRLRDNYGDILDSLEEYLSSDEIDVLNAEFDPITWFKIHSIDKDKLQDRFYQTMILRCSAKNKSIRAGRRIGKTFSIAMKVIHKIATSPEPIEVLVGAPQITMIDEIRQTIEALCDNLDIPNFIRSIKNQPILQIKFFNGSLLKGITAGTDGKSARGKKAHIIWLDEVDFIATKAMDAIKGVQLDNPDVEMIYTSTPIGEGNLYRFSKMDITKEFHYPTFANPYYTDEMHATISDLSDVAYAQEILGIFGVDADGVFSPGLIAKAEELFIDDLFTKDFVLNNRERFILFIGVDWNHDNNGTRIIVVAFDKELGVFFKVEGFRIAKLQMTQSLAIRKVVEVNREYNADHILCDEGFGTAQISELRLKGEEQYGKVAPNHPDIKLVDTVSVNFASTVTITDPVTKKPLKRNTKQYMVEYAQKTLEDGKLALSSDNDSELMAQMKNYHIASKGMRGNVYKPKDKKIGDHDLDAFMLALYGFEMFYSGFIKQQVSPYAAVVGNTNTRYEAIGRADIGTVATFRKSRSVSTRGGVRRAKRRSF